MKLLNAERALSKELIRIKSEEAQARAEINAAVLQAAIDGLGVLAEIAGRETALGKALFLEQQAAAKIHCRKGFQRNATGGGGYPLSARCGRLR